MIDAARLTDLFAAYGGPLALYARQFDAGDTDELVQEAFVRLLGERAEPPNVRAWLLLTLRRLAIDRRRGWLRRRKRERRHDAACGRGAWFVARPGDAIDARRAAELLRRLPPRQREAIVLRVWHDLPLGEIATLLGVATSTVHADLAAGLATLRMRMEPTHVR